MRYTLDVDSLSGHEEDRRGTAERAYDTRRAVSLPAAFRRVPEVPNAPIRRDVAIDTDLGLPGGTVATATGVLDRMTEAEVLAEIDERRADEVRETGQRRPGSPRPRRLQHQHPTTFPW